MVRVKRRRRRRRRRRRKRGSLPMALEVKMTPIVTLRAKVAYQTGSTQSSRHLSLNRLRIV